VARWVRSLIGHRRLDGLHDAGEEVENRGEVFGGLPEDLAVGS
jgi:hypothetical protein